MDKFTVDDKFMLKVNYCEVPVRVAELGKLFVVYELSNNVGCYGAYDKRKFKQRIVGRL